MTDVTYNEYVNLMVVMLSVESATDANFVIYLPRMIEYAENRLFRDMDFLNTMKEADTGDLTAGNRVITVPGNITIVQSAAVVTPASTPAASGTRKPLQRVSVEALNFLAPTGTQGIPIWYALIDETNMALGPTPDAAYRVAVYGQYQPAPLSIGNSPTFLSTNFPDLYVAASLVFGFGEQQNFGAQSDNPQAAMSWETQYQTLLKAADLNEDRKKAWSAAWQAMTPSDVSKDARTS